MIILARVGAADGHDDEFAVFEQQLVADRRFEQFPVLVDPPVQIEGRRGTHAAIISRESARVFQAAPPKDWPAERSFGTKLHREPHGPSEFGGGDAARPTVRCGVFGCCAARGRATSGAEAATAGAAAQPRAPADTGDPMPAVWKEQHVEFSYAGRTSRYSCDGLLEKVRAMLLDLGARRDVKITPLRCADTEPMRGDGGGLAHQDRVLLAGASGGRGQAAARGRSGGDRRALRAIHHHERRISQHGDRGLRVGAGIHASNTAEVDGPRCQARYPLCTVQAEREPVLRPRRGIQEFAARRRGAAAARATRAFAADRALAGPPASRRNRCTPARRSMRPTAARSGCRPRRIPCRVRSSLGRAEETECRPMPEHDSGAAPRGVLGLEPGNERIGRIFRGPFGAQSEPAACVHVPQAREAIDDEAQSLCAGEGLVPAVRLVAVHPVEKSPGVLAARRARTRVRSFAPSACPIEEASLRAAGTD